MNNSDWLLVDKRRMPDFNNIEFGNVWGAGVGLCPPNLLPPEVVPMPNCYVKSVGNANYGNYTCKIDGSQMVYVPACAEKITGNNKDIKPMRKWNYDINAAAADGYAVFRCFINAGKLVKGKFIDKTKWSLTSFINNTSGVASSILNSNPISSAPDSKRDASNNYAGSFSNCKSNMQSPTNTYAGAIGAAKSRGNNFYSKDIFTHYMLASLSLAQAQAVSSTAFCAWFDSTGEKSFPKGDNNYGADYNDSSVTFTACDDAYWSGRNEARKCGSGSNLAKTTHNGQTCGIADLNGNQYEISLGITCAAVSKNITGITRAAQAVFTVAAHGYSNDQIIFIDGSSTAEWNNAIQQLFAQVEVIDANTVKLKKRTNDVNNGSYVDTSLLSADYSGSGFTIVTGTFYELKESADIRTLTAGNTLATDHWGATGIAANFDAIDLSAILINKYSTDRFGSGSNQVFAFSTDRASNDYKKTSAMLPAIGTSISSGGTNQFGIDMFYKYIRNELCAIVSGNWNGTSSAGVWDLSLSNNRTNSFRDVSARSCLNVLDV